MTCSGTLGFAFGLGMRSELKAPRDTKTPAVNAAQRVPSVIAWSKMLLTVGSLAKMAVRVGENPPERPNRVC